MDKMKSKSSHHRTENRFKFQTFSERIAKINIDVIRKGGRTENTPRDADSFFAEGLAKWAELNCTQDFVAFHREVVGCTNTFAQLVHHEQKVVDALKRYLKSSISLAYPPLLDLVVQLARDLQTDFYPHFRDFFDLTVALLNTQDTEIIENAFQTLVYLFKFLWRYLLRDIKDVFGFYSPLLSLHQKAHIRNFAAESFGFLMRKVNDPSDLFDFMLSSLEQQPDQVSGVGRLFFEMTKGVCKQFHSCTERVLPILLDKLGPCQSAEGNLATSLPWKLVLETLSEMFTSMAKYTSTEHTHVVWTSLQNCMLNLHQCITSEDSQPSDVLEDYHTQLTRVLELVTQWVQYNIGALIAEPTQLAKVILQLYSGSKLRGDCGDQLLSLTVALLSGTNATMPQDVINKLVSAMYGSKYAVPQLLKVSKEAFEINNFEQDMLPPLVQYCHSNMATKSLSTKEDILFALTDLLLCKQPLVSESADLQSYKPYILDFRMAVHRGKTKPSAGTKRVSFPGYILSRLDFPEDLLAEANVIPSLWAALVCLPSVRPIDVDLCNTKLRKLIEDLWSIVSVKNDPESDTLLYLLSQAILCLHLINLSKTKELLLEPDFIIQLLQTIPTSPLALLAVDVYFSQSSTQNLKEYLTAEILDQIFPSLQPNLSSPNHKVRLLTLRILNQFPVNLPGSPDLPVKHVSVFKLCLEAEQVPITVEDYREKLKFLRRLDHAASRHNIPIGKYHEVPLRYLLGMLYVNFSLLWNPVMDLIKSYAYGMNKKTFWGVFIHHLQMAATRTESDFQSTGENGTQQRKAPASQIDREVPSNLTELFSRCQEDQLKILDRPDDWNHRLLLWKAMGVFPDLAERKTRELVPLVFRFIKNEYYPADVNNAPTQDLRKRDKTNSPSDQSELETVEDVTQSEESEKTHRKKRIGAVNRCLVAKFQLFSKFHDPKSMYLEPQLRELYFKLLSIKNGLVQKSVLACIMTYKYKYLIPYKENFDALMEDKSFREALVQFSIDETNGVVQEEDRKGLLPVLFRILYGKMLSKTGTGTQGRAGGSVRRSIILRFLAGSQSVAEIYVFMELVVEPCQHLIQDNFRVMMQSVLSNLDLAAVVPLKKQHSMLDTLSVIFDKLGNLIDSYKPTMLHLITCQVAAYTKMLEQRHEIQPFSVNQLKNLRQIGMQLLAKFFEHFDAYPFSANEIDCIYEAAVWPTVERLANESLASPTTLLKLFAVWSKNPRYHRLLAKHHPENEQVTAIPNVVALLSSTNAASSVVAMVMDIVEHLLLESDFEASDDVPEIDVSDVIRVWIDNEDQFEVLPTFGTKLLFPHMPAILEFLSSSVKVKSQALRKDSNEQLPMMELNILSKISIYIQDPKQCGVLIAILLPYLEKTTEKQQTIELDILHTIRNIMKLVKDPGSFLGPVSRLLYRLTLRPSRAALCGIFAAMAYTDAGLRDISDTVHKMNAWDRKRFEEPDFKKRLEAFKFANQRLAAVATIDIQFCTPVIYNSFYFIMKVDEMSLRDNASQYLMAVVDKLSQENVSSETFNAIIIHKFVPSIRAGFRLKSENARFQLIGLLSRIGQCFPDHPRFVGLNSLRDENDIEVDFYENICHIQIHRRLRALRRLSHHCKEDKIPANTLNYFLLPITTAIVFDLSANKDNNLTVEAINTVGIISSKLPWRCYIVILKQYLRLLTKSIDLQKIAVRLVVAVLDGFHFDLSLSEEIQAIKLPTSTEDKPKVVVSKTEEEEDDDSSSEEEDSAEEDENKKDVATATRIHTIIVSSILPQLHGMITKKVLSEENHRKVRGNMAGDEEVLRVPIALAMVKLLQAVPKKTMHQNLSSVLLKVCHMQKSRAKDVRDISRDTLIKILASLGISYWPYILKELRHALTRGYQLHVLSYTVHALLNSSLAKLQPGNLDSSLKSFIAVFNADIFGTVADEKEVKGIVGKLFEARSTKSYDSYEIVAKFLGQGSLTQLILPLKEILDTTHSHKMVKKVQEILRHMTFGLLDNTGISMEAMLVFIYGLVSESLPLITNALKAKEKAAAIPPPDPRLATTSVYILPKKPTRGSVVQTKSIKTNAHIIIEFGLQLLHMNLKRSRFKSSNKQHMTMLDPFVNFLMKCLDSKHVKVTTVGLRCITWLLRFPLPSVDKQAPELTKILFRLLKNYSSTGQVKTGSGNFDLVVICFKAMTVLVRNVKQHSIDEDQLKVLLTYVEEDIHDDIRQSTAFGLLKAILSRKLVVPEIHEVMKKVRQLSIVTDAPGVRLQCRQVLLGFLLDYPLGNKIRQHLEFYVNQVAYPVEAGRVSALEMLATIFSAFPQKVLCKYAGLFYIPIAARLMNEESTKCRKLTALAIKSFLQKVDVVKRDELFEITLAWLNEDEKLTHQCLAAQLCGTFVEAEEADIQRRLDTLLPVMCERIKPRHFPQDMDSDSETEGTDREKEERQSDHLLFHLLSSLAKLFQHCAILKNPQYALMLNDMWESVQYHLLHPHAWVRLTSAQLFGVLFATWKPDELVTEATNLSTKSIDAPATTRNTKTPKKKKMTAAEDTVEENRPEVKGYLEDQLHKRISDLATQSCHQLQSIYCNKEIGDQVVRNLVFMAKVLIRIQPDLLTKTEPLNFRTAQNPDNEKHLHSTITSLDDVTYQTEDVTYQTEDVTYQTDDITDPTDDVIDNVTDQTDVTDKTNDVIASKCRTIDILWLIKRMCIVASREAAKPSGQTLKRTCVVKWIAAVAVELGVDKIAPYLIIMMRPINREINNKMLQEDSELKVLCTEVLQLLKSLVGLDVFSQAYTSLQRQTAELKFTRKRKQTLEAVIDPDKAAQRKIKKQLAKKESKKRRIQAKRPTYQINKRRRFNKPK